MRPTSVYSQQMQQHRGNSMLKGLHIGPHKEAILCAGARPAVLGDGSSTAPLLARLISLISAGSLDTAILVAQDEENLAIPFSIQSAASQTFSQRDLRPGDIVAPSLKTRNEHAELLHQIMMFTHVPCQFLRMEKEAIVVGRVSTLPLSRALGPGTSHRGDAPTPDAPAREQEEDTDAEQHGRVTGRTMKQPDAKGRAEVLFEGHVEDSVQGCGVHAADEDEPQESADPDADMNVHEATGRPRSTQYDLTGLLRDRRHANAARLTRRLDASYAEKVDQ